MGEKYQLESKTYTPLDNWQVSQQPESVLSNLLVNGKSIVTFDPRNFTYQLDAKNSNTIQISADTKTSKPP